PLLLPRRPVRPGDHRGGGRRGLSLRLHHVHPPRFRPSAAHAAAPHALAERVARGARTLLAGGDVLSGGRRVEPPGGRVPPGSRGMIAERETPAPLALPPAVLLMAGRTAGFVAAFAIPIVLVRVLDQAAFGTYKQLFLVAATLYGVGQLGMAESLFYFLPRAPGDGARYLANAILALGAGGLACLVALAAGGPALARWLGNPELARHATALGVYMLLMLLSAALEIVMISRKRYERAAWLYGALDVVRAGCLLLPVLVAPDVHWLLLGAVGFALLRCGAAAGYFRREFGDALRPDAGLLRRQLAYALPFQLAGMVEIAQVNLHQYAVASAFDPPTVAVYAVACLP